MLSGVPAIVALPFISVKLRPGGRNPDSDSVGVGKPVVLTVNENATPTVAVADGLEVIAGASSTVNVKVWVAVPVLLFAFRTMVYVPPLCAAGSPVMLAAPGSPSSKLTPDGSAPVSVMFGSGEALAVTEKLNDVPTVTVVLGGDVKVGPSSTVRTKSCVLGEPIPLEALMVIG